MLQRPHYWIDMLAYMYIGDWNSHRGAWHETIWIRGLMARGEGLHKENLVCCTRTCITLFIWHLQHNMQHDELLAGCGDLYPGPPLCTGWTSASVLSKKNISFQIYTVYRRSLIANSLSSGFVMINWDFWGYTYMLIMLLGVVELEIPGLVTMFYIDYDMFQVIR